MLYCKIYFNTMDAIRKLHSFGTAAHRHKVGFQALLTIATMIISLISMMVSYLLFLEEIFAM